MPNQSVPRTRRKVVSAAGVVGAAGIMPVRLHASTERGEICSLHVKYPDEALAATVPPQISPDLQYAKPAPFRLSTEERRANEQIAFFVVNRPQTLYAITDSPRGLAAWTLDHDARTYALLARAFKGQAAGLATAPLARNRSRASPPVVGLLRKCLGIDGTEDIAALALVMDAELDFGAGAGLYTLSARLNARLSKLARENAQSFIDAVQPLPV